MRLADSELLDHVNLVRLRADLVKRRRRVVAVIACSSHHVRRWQSSTPARRFISS